MSSTIDAQSVIHDAWARLRLYCRSGIWVVGIGVLLVMGLNVQPALAGRYVLNQNPTTIERSFGHYWTKLTQTDGKGEKSITYTYSPAPLQHFFPDRPFATLSMTYVNGRVHSVTMRPYRTAQENAMTPLRRTKPEPIKPWKLNCLRQSLAIAHPSISPCI